MVKGEFGAHGDQKKSNVGAGMRLRRVAPLIAITLLAGCLQPPFGPSEGGLKYTDNRTITHRSLECTNDHYNYFNWFVVDSLTQDYDAPTVLTHSQLTPNPCGGEGGDDDIQWFAAPQSTFSTPTTRGDWICQTSSGTSSNNCQRGRMRFSEYYLPSGDASNMVCHEIGHAVGFQHGDTGLSCMDGGNTGTTDTYMRNRINGHY
jgi:hypothetical protein